MTKDSGRVPVVTEQAWPPVPAWVSKRDGSLVPFEADKISRALFGATERLGHPDAFLARELTDGVVHFLTTELDGALPTTAQIADLVIKVVRELGQPALAQAFEDGARTKQGVERRQQTEQEPEKLVLSYRPGDPPGALVRQCLRAYSLRTVFARDLVSAQSDGLLTLTGLEAPLELAGCVLGRPAADERPAEAIAAIHRLAGDLVAIDGPEFFLARWAVEPSEYARELCLGLRATGLRAIVNLHANTAPSWADDLATGPLFAGQRGTPEPAELAHLAEALLEELLAPDRRTLDQQRPRLRIDWHLAERDFLPGAEARLVRLVRRAVDGEAVAFTFDRPRRPLALAEGIDRRHPATLLMIAMHLSRLAEQVAGRGGGPELFLQKLGSLARLALSAAAQKRDFLRRHGTDRPALARGFLLDRARLVAAPIGLDQAVTALLGEEPAAGGRAQDLARQIMRRLQEVLQHDGRASHLDACLDGSRLAAATFLPEDEGCPWAGAATTDAKSALRTAGAVSTAVDVGTVVLIVPDQQPPNAEQAAEWLRRTWKQTDVARVRLARITARPQQLTFGSISEGSGSAAP